jgi:hypothetical protein
MRKGCLKGKGKDMDKYELAVFGWVEGRRAEYGKSFG